MITCKIFDKMEKNSKKSQSTKDHYAFSLVKQGNGRRSGIHNSEKLPRNNNNEKETNKQRIRGFCSANNHKKKKSKAKRRITVIIKSLKAGGRIKRKSKTIPISDWTGDGESVRRVILRWTCWSPCRLVRRCKGNRKRVEMVAKSVNSEMKRALKKE